MDIKISMMTVSVHLSCEDYNNAGATYEMFEEIINSINDPGSFGKIRCSRTGINNNPKFSMSVESFKHIDMIIDTIEDKIRDKLGLDRLKPWERRKIYPC